MIAQKNFSITSCRRESCGVAHATPHNEGIMRTVAGIVILCFFAVFGLFHALASCAAVDTTLMEQGQMAGEEFPATDEQAVSGRIIDGDTLVVFIGGKEYRCRLIGVDTPEMSTDFGAISKAFTEAEIGGEGTELVLQFDVGRTDKYGRMLAYVWTKDDYYDGIAAGEPYKTMLNYEFVLQGYARLMTVPPNVAYEDKFRQAEQVALESGVGIWENYEELFAD